MLTEVPGSALQIGVLLSRADPALAEAMGISHGFWRGIHPSLSSKVNLETDFLPFNT